MSVLLKYYNSIGNNENLKNLVKKTAVVIMILHGGGGRRKQALFTITVDNIVDEKNKIVFIPNKTLKHTNTRRHYNHLFTIDILQTLHCKLCQLSLKCPGKVSRCECDGIYYHIWKATQTGFVGYYITMDKI